MKEKDLDTVLQKLREAAEKVYKQKSLEKIEQKIKEDDYVRYFVYPHMLVDAFNLNKWPKEFIASTSKPIRKIIDDHYSPELCTIRYTSLISNGFNEKLLDKVLYNIVVTMYGGEKVYLDLDAFNDKIGGDLLISGFDLMIYNAIEYLSRVKNPYLVEVALIQVGLSSTYAHDLVEKIENILIRIRAFYDLDNFLKEKVRK